MSLTWCVHLSSPPPSQNTTGQLRRAAWLRRFYEGSTRYEDTACLRCSPRQPQSGFLTRLRQFRVEEGQVQAIVDASNMW